MPRRNIEQELAALKALETCGTTAQVQIALKKVLRDRVNVMVAKAAELAGSLQLRELVPDLCAAFDRLLENAAATDPQCWGKNAIAKALADLGHTECEHFVRGLRHVQREPVWGRLVDTALTLRGTCALALIAVRDLPRREILQYLTQALTDSYEAGDEREREEAAPVRRDSVRAIEQLGGEEARLILRLKARTGDSDPGVTGQIFDSLLRIEGDAAIPFVADFLNWPDTAVGEEAALALGASRLPGAIRFLETAWHVAPTQALRDAILRALSTSGREQAIDFLLQIARSGREREALSAIRALGLHSVSESLRSRLAEAIAARTEEPIAAAFAALG